MMTVRRENGDIFVSLKWVIGILAVSLISMLGAWGIQRHIVESELMGRIIAVEKLQTRMLERLEGNTDKLGTIYQELKQHREQESMKGERP